MNIAIIGSGLNGSLSAIALANAGCRVDLYDRLSDEELINRDGTYIITHASRKILEKIGIWSDIVTNLVPFQHLNVIDIESNNQIEFLVKDLKIKDQKYLSIGWTAEHKNIMTSILKTISEQININKIPTSIIPNTKNYDLIIEADGSNSNTKKKRKTAAFYFNYDQICITAKVLLRGLISNEAFEILNPEGPVSVLPLGQDQYQIICCQSKAKGSYNMSISRSLFLDYLSTILPYGIEPDSIIGELRSYPVKFVFNYSLFSGKYICLGNSAHEVHPIGGQGFNLCWRDINCLSKLISMKTLKNNHSFIPLIYSLFRIFDVLSVSFFTDSLVRYSRCNLKIIILIRKFIFLVLKKSTKIKKFTFCLMTNDF